MGVTVFIFVVRVEADAGVSQHSRLFSVSFFICGISGEYSTHDLESPSMLAGYILTHRLACAARTCRSSTGAAKVTVAKVTRRIAKSFIVCDVVRYLTRTKWRSSTL
jgi:hypothetical protein